VRTAPAPHSATRDCDCAVALACLPVLALIVFAVSISRVVAADSLPNQILQDRKTAGTGPRAILRNLIGQRIHGAIATGHGPTVRTAPAPHSGTRDCDCAVALACLPVLALIVFAVSISRVVAADSLPNQVLRDRKTAGTGPRATLRNLIGQRIRGSIATTAAR
jgi:hypothetical protein